MRAEVGGGGKVEEEADVGEEPEGRRAETVQEGGAIGHASRERSPRQFWRAVQEAMEVGGRPRGETRDSTGGRCSMPLKQGGEARINTGERCQRPCK